MVGRERRKCRRMTYTFARTRDAHPRDRLRYTCISFRPRELWPGRFRLLPFNIGGTKPLMLR